MWALRCVWLSARCAGKLGEVVGDYGTLRMELLRVGGERR
jgi:hypothetical protein